MVGQYLAFDSKAKSCIAFIGRKTVKMSRNLLKWTVYVLFDYECKAVSGSIRIPDDEIEMNRNFCDSCDFLQFCSRH